MHSIQVTRMPKGYNDHATDLGYQEKGAVFFTKVQMHTLLESTHRSCSSNTDQHQL